MSRLRVMTFNVHGAYNWERRIPLNVEIIKHAAPDITGFQEAQTANLEVYEQELPEYDYIPGPEIEGEAASYNAIFWNPSRLEPIESYGY